MFITLPEKLYNTVVGVAVSGGKDSMALLSCLLKEHKEEFKEIVVVNVEHGIRGEESVKDTEFVKDFCLKNGVKFYGYKVDTLKRVGMTGESEEEAARNLRYDCFLNAVDTKKCDYILTAHHKSDLAESVLFNVFRGTGIKGLMGIPFMTERAVRPLLYTDKAEIDAYVAAESIPYVTDKTNFDTKYSRNYLREKIIPELKERFPFLEDGVLRLSHIAADTESFMDGFAEKKVLSDERGYYISLTDEEVVNKAVFYRAVIKILKKLGVKKDYELKHAEAAYSLIDKQSGALRDLIGNITAVNEYDKIRFFIKSDGAEPEYDLKPADLIKSSFEFSYGMVSIERIQGNVADFTERGVLYASYEALSGIKELKIRTRRDGDYFKPYNSGTKKLNDYFTDKKIPRLLRDEIPLLADGNRILCVFGIQISDDVKIKNKFDQAEKLFCAKKEKDQ